ncbi:MAG: hypothetical protein AB7L09_00300 [Nitrospira sp.]
MADHNNIPDLQVFGKGSGDFKLPTGYVDSTGRVFNRIYLREMTGVEDDIMDDDELNISERMTRVIVNCTEKLATADAGPDGRQPTVITDRATIMAAVSDNLTDGGLPLTIPDRLAALLFIRQTSGGDRYQLDGRPCPACTKPLKNKHIMLSSLQINYCKDATKRRVRVKLPRSGKIAILKMLTASNERKVAESRPDLRDVKSLAILSRLESLDDKVLSGDPETELDIVRSLPRMDRILLIQTFNLMEGSIETEITVKCTNPKCSVDFTFDLDLGQVFFSSPEMEVSLDDLDWV